MADTLSPVIPKAGYEVAVEGGRVLRKATAIASLGLNYASVVKQALTQIPLTIIAKSPPKLRSKFAKKFSIKVSD